MKASFFAALVAFIVFVFGLFVFGPPAQANQIPPCSMILTSFADGHTAWAYGWKDSAGYVHIESQPTEWGHVPMGAIDSTGATNYGLLPDSRAPSLGGSVVRASSVAAEDVAWNLAAARCPDDSCKIPNPFREAEDDVERIAIFAACAAVVIVALGVAVVVTRKAPK